MEPPNQWQVSLRKQLADKGIRGNPEKIWAVFTCRNEIDFLPGFFRHHRSIGIHNYIVIDDQSTDGSSEFLADQPDVTLLKIDARYPEYKHDFRSIICDEVLEGKWVLFLDVDERFAYRGMECTKVPDLVSLLEDKGHSGAVAIMIDAYRLDPDSQFDNHAPLGSQGYWFDSSSYRAVYTNAATQRKWPTPPFDYFGGAQERLFFCSPLNSGTPIEKLLARFSLNTVGAIHQSRNTLVNRFLTSVSKALARFSNQCPTTPPKQNKVVLLKWEAGCRFSGGVHRVSTEPNLWPERTGLLHLKIKEGYAEKVSRLASEEHHAGRAEVYKHILARGADPRKLQERLKYAGSVRFTSSKDLENAGLIG